VCEGAGCASMHACPTTIVPPRRQVYAEKLLDLLDPAHKHIE
jgi:hypothetical protein